MAKTGSNLVFYQWDKLDEDITLYTYILECHSAIRQNVILPFVTTEIDLESIMPSEISHTEKDKCHVD